MKAKGTAFETQVKEYLHANGFPNAYRPATAGASDSGDINGIKQPGYVRPGGFNSDEVWVGDRQAVIQCKNHKTFSLSGWLNDAKEQAKQSAVGGDALPLVVFKRPGIGTKNLGKTYALMELEDLVQLLKEAGYS